jgi:hypothetical protein
MLDFVAWPACREFAVSVPAMGERMEWLMDMSISITCDWPFSQDDAFERDEETGMLHMCEVAKVRDGNGIGKSQRTKHSLTVPEHLSRSIELVASAVFQSLREQRGFVCTNQDG